MTVSSLISTLTQTEGLVDTPMANKQGVVVCVPFFGHDREFAHLI